MMVANPPWLRTAGVRTVWEFRVWFTACWCRGYNHGAELVRYLGTPRGRTPGLVDNVATADKLLAAALAAGWVHRSERPIPTREQSFLGVGGSWAGSWKGTNVYPVTFGYSPNTANAEAASWVLGRSVGATP